MRAATALPSQKPAKSCSEARLQDLIKLHPIGHPNVMSPPLIITESDVDFIAGTLEKAITRVTDDPVREGHKPG